MAKPDLFTKSPTERRFLLPIFGPGVFLAEGDTHRRMRKALARPCWSSLSPSLLVELPTADLPCSHDLLLRLPARPPAQAPSFSNASLKSLTPTFYAKAHELVERLETVADAGGDETSGPQKGAVNVALWLTRAALDLIGAAGASPALLPRPRRSKLIRSGACCRLRIRLWRAQGGGERDRPGFQPHVRDGVPAQHVRHPAAVPAAAAADRASPVDFGPHAL